MQGTVISACLGAIIGGFTFSAKHENGYHKLSVESYSPLSSLSYGVAVALIKHGIELFISDQ